MIRGYFFILHLVFCCYFPRTSRHNLYEKTIGVLHSLGIVSHCILRSLSHTQGNSLFSLILPVLFLHIEHSYEMFFCNYHNKPYSLCPLIFYMYRKLSFLWLNCIINTIICDQKKKNTEKTKKNHNTETENIFCAKIVS